MERKYVAFISYRNVPLDAALAKNLHRQIEGYIIPRKLRRNEKRFGTVFRDMEEMPASNDLRQELKDALDQSEYLIVICSPDTKNSRWVQEEIEYFLEHHPHNQVFTVLAKGEAEDVIPSVLQSRIDAQSGESVKVIPLAVDARGSTIAASCRKLCQNITKLYAGMLGCSHGAVVLRHQRRIRKRLSLVFLAVLLVTLSFTVMILRNNLKIEKKNQEIEQQNQAIAAQNQELEEKNRELEQQKAEIQLRESELLTQKARDSLTAGDRHAAIKYAAAALPATESERPYYAPAEQALIEAMGYLEQDPIDFVSMRSTLESEWGLSDYCMSADGSRVVCVNIYGGITCFDTETGDICWKYTTETLPFNPYLDTYASTKPVIVYCKLTDSAIFSYDGTMVAFSLTSGEILWSRNDARILNGRPMLSRDGQMLVFLMTRVVEDYAVDYFEYTNYFIAVSAETGETLRDINLSAMFDQYPELSEWIFTFQHWYVGSDTTEGLSENNQVFVGSVVVSQYIDYSPEEYTFYYAVDLEKGTCRIVYSQVCTTDSLSPIYVSCTADGGKMLVIQPSVMDNASCAVLEMFDLERDVSIWRSALPGTKAVLSSENNDYFDDCEVYHQFLGDNLLIGIQDVLFWVDTQTGCLKSSMEFDTDIVQLVSFNDCSYHLVLRSGEYWFGSIADAGFSAPQFITSTGIPVNNLPQGNINYGTDQLNGSSVKIKTDPAGRTVLSVVGMDNICRVDVFRVDMLGNLVPRQEVEIPGELVSFTHRGAGFAGENTFALGKFMRYNDGEIEDFYVLLDTGTYQTKYLDAHTSSEAFVSEYRVRFLPNGSGYIQERRHSSDLLLGFGRDDFPLFLDETEAWKYSLWTVTHDQQIVGIRMNEDHFLIRRDSDDPVYLPHPDPLRNAEEYCVELGRNGLAVCMYTHGQQSPRNGFIVYDTASLTWIEIPEEESAYFHNGEVYSSSLCVGNERPVFSIWDMQGNIHVYNCSTKERISEFRPDIPFSIMLNMEFILDDQYLLIQTEDGRISISDTLTGEIVFIEQSFSYSNLWGNEHWAQVYEDEENHRLYLVGHSNHSDYHAVCLDTRTWMKMAEIPGMIAFDERNNVVYRCISQSYTGNMKVIAYQIPGTQELVALANTFLTAKPKD